MASYRELSRVARLVDGLIDIDLITDDELDSLLECADDESELMAVARQIAGTNRFDSSVEKPSRDRIGGEEPQLLSGILRRGFQVFRGGKA